MGTVDAGNRDSHAFFDRVKLLYAPLADVRQVHDEVRQRYDYEVQKRAGGDLGLEDPPPPLTAETVRERFGKAAEKFEQKGNGYYMGEDGKMLAILIPHASRAGRHRAGPPPSRQDRRHCLAAQPKSFDPGMKVQYTGDFVTSVEEYESVKNDLGHVGFYGVLMVLGAVLLYFLAFAPCSPWA